MNCKSTAKTNALRFCLENKLIKKNYGKNATKKYYQI